MQNEDAITGPTFIKMIFVVDPLLSQMMTGNFEKMLSCQSGVDFMLLLSQLSRDYFLNESIDEERRYQVFKHFCTFKPTNEILTMFHHSSDQTKAYLTELTNEFKKMFEVMKQFGYRPYEKTEEDYRLSFKKFISHQKQVKSSSIQINKIIDPFYLEDHQHFLEMKKSIYEKLTKASSDTIVKIMEVVGNKKMKRINSFEFTFDLNEMTKHECSIIYKILCDSENSFEDENMCSVSKSMESL